MLRSQLRDLRSYFLLLLSWELCFEHRRLMRYVMLRLLKVKLLAFNLQATALPNSIDCNFCKYVSMLNLSNTLCQSLTNLYYLQNFKPFLKQFKYTEK